MYLYKSEQKYFEESCSLDQSPNIVSHQVLKI